MSLLRIAFTYSCILISMITWSLMSIELDASAIRGRYNGDALEHEHGRCSRGASSIASPILYEPVSFDVLHYDVYLNLRAVPVPVTNGSTCRIVFRWTSTPDSLRVHLRSLRIDSACYVTKTARIPVTPRSNGNDSTPNFYYSLPALASHKQGDTVAVEIVYSGTMTSEPSVGGMSWGGVSRDQTDALYSLGVGFANAYVSCTQHWMPCYDVPADKATLHIRIESPRSCMAVSNGTLVQQTPVDSAGMVYEWDMKEECATYLMTFAVGPYIETSQGVTSAGAPILCYGKKGDTARCRNTFKNLARMVRTFEQRFAPYPFSKVGYVVTNLGSMEHQTLICLARGEIQSLSDSVNKTVAHELAHQWFGDLVTPRDFRDAWLTESFATYSECLWNEELGGRSLYLSDLKNKITSYLTTVGKPGGRSFEGVLPIYDFPRTKPSSNYPQTIYLKGAGVLAMLRELVGDESFFASLQSYVRDHAYGNATYDTLVQSFVKTAPLPLRDSITQFFSEWVQGRGWPMLDITASQVIDSGRARVLVNVKQVQADSMGRYSWFPLELTFTDTQGRRLNRVITVRGDNYSVLLDSLSPVSGISINSGSRIHTLAVLLRAPVVTGVGENRSTDDANANADATDIRVVPNPAHTLAEVFVPTAGEWWCELVNMDGRVIHTSSAMMKGGEAIHVSLSELPAGTYVVRMRSGAKSYTNFVTRLP